MISYEQRAIAWAERYGIIEYKVSGNKMIYYKTYRAYLSNPAYTVKHEVNLDNMTEATKVLKKVNKQGYRNV